MRICILTCAALIAAVPASAQDAALGIELIPGHPVYHEREKEAGVVMALSITPGQDQATDLMALCEELRGAAGLGNGNGDELRLETVFVVPYKGMAVEGYYWPDDPSEEGTLVPGNGLARATLDGVVARAGIPPSLLDETDVEQEISCDPNEPFWYVAWSDVRPIGDEAPEAVIERARLRFLEIHLSVIEHNTREQHLVKAQRSVR